MTTPIITLPKADRDLALKYVSECLNRAEHLSFQTGEKEFSDGLVVIMIQSGFNGPLGNSRNFGLARTTSRAVPFKNGMKFFRVSRRTTLAERTALQLRFEHTPGKFLEYRDDWCFMHGGMKADPACAYRTRDQIWEADLTDPQYYGTHVPLLLGTELAESEFLDEKGRFCLNQLVGERHIRLGNTLIVAAQSDRGPRGVWSNDLRTDEQRSAEQSQKDSVLPPLDATPAEFAATES